MRNAEKPEQWKANEAAEPCAVKGASTVRKGADGKGLSFETTCRIQANQKEKTIPRWPPTLPT
jgi:hypothetical protein